jgi:hypothetical protein
MLYGTPTRAAHRAADDSGLGQVIRSLGSTGQHRLPPAIGTPAHSRPRPQRRAPAQPDRAAQWLARGLAAVIVVGMAVMIGLLTLADRRRGEPVGAAADRLSSRDVDPAPLTLDEVFGNEETVPGTGYRIDLTHSDAACASATTGVLGALLRQHGCDQVIRASMTAPYGDYQVTAGLFNLADAAGALDVDGRLRQLVETGDGGFAPMAQPAADDPIGQVGWHARGHYLLYCVITRPGGQLVTPDDPNAVRITDDLVDSYLGEAVLGRRAPSA